MCTAANTCGSASTHVPSTSDEPPTLLQSTPEHPECQGQLPLLHQTWNNRPVEEHRQRHRLRRRLWPQHLRSIHAGAIIGGSDRTVSRSLPKNPDATSTPPEPAGPAPSTACAARPTSSSSSLPKALRLAHGLAHPGPVIGAGYPAHRNLGDRSSVLFVTARDEV